MKKTFIINGGAGRVVTSIPALERYAMENPNEDFNIISHAWSEFYHGNRILQDKVLNINENIFKYIKDTEIVSPEPYYDNDYINQRAHLIHAFDKAINGDTNLKQLPIPSLHVAYDEHVIVKNILNKIKEEKKRDKVLVFQPYGSGIGIRNERPFDGTYRSFDVDIALKLIYELSKKYVVIYFGEKEFYHPGDSYSVNMFDNHPDLRLYLTLISQCDYFLGCDSLGQHIAASFNKPGTVVLGSTFKENVSYDHFKIYRNKHLPVYSPIRLCNSAAQDRINSYCMVHDEFDIENILQTIP